MHLKGLWRLPGRQNHILSIQLDTYKVFWVLFYVCDKCKILLYTKVFKVIHLDSLKTSPKFDKKKGYIFSFNFYMKFNILFSDECRSYVTVVLVESVTLSPVEITDTFILYSIALNINLFIYLWCWELNSGPCFCQAELYSHP